MTYDIFTKALQMLKEREEYHGDQGTYDDKTYTVRMCELSEANAYHNAWWILYHAIHEDWDALDKLDNYHFNNEEEEEE